MIKLRIIFTLIMLCFALIAYLMGFFTALYLIRRKDE